VSAAAAEAMISSELWVSFSSLLRSYAAAASLNSAESAEVAATDHSISIAAGSARLEMLCNTATGAGNWSLRSSNQDRQGRFELLPDGRIELDGTTLDLDHAAIDFAALLMQAAAKSAREES
jgi:hypothetical protein